MVRWLRRLLVMFCAVVLGLIAVAIVGFHMAHAAPNWYRPMAWSPEELAIAANNVDQKLIDSFNWASQVQNRRARERFAAEHGSTLPSTEAPPGPKTLSITEEELNGFFQKWLAGRPDITSAIGKYATDVRIALGQNQLILAGRLLKLNSVVSVQLDTSIDGNGKLVVRLAQVDLGTLPMPRSLLSSQFATARDALLDHLPAWQEKAAFDRDGCANSGAVAAAMGKLALAILDDQPAAALAFLPAPSDHGKPLPVIITQLTTTSDGLNITVDAPGDAQRGEILSQIRAPYGATGSAAANETPAASETPAANATP